MLDLILTTIITSLFCCGLHFVTRDGWVLAPLDYFLVERLGGRITYSFSEQIMDEERKIYWKREWLGEIYKPTRLYCLHGVNLGHSGRTSLRVGLIPYSYFMCACSGSKRDYLL